MFVFCFEHLFYTDMICMHVHPVMIVKRFAMDFLQSLTRKYESDELVDCNFSLLKYDIDIFWEFLGCSPSQ